MAKDIIYNRWKPDNPLCIMADGSKRHFIAICYNHEVLVQNKNNLKKYIYGKIIGQKKENDVWIYRVETKIDDQWRGPNEFKHA